MARTSLESLAPAHKRVLGLLTAGIGSLGLWLVHALPHALPAPAGLLIAGFGAFVVAGIAVGLHGWLSRRAYAWAMVALVALLTAVPGWVAFGPGPRRCASLLFFLAGAAGCRIAFGAATLAMLAVLAATVAHARRLGGPGPGGR